MNANATGAQANGGAVNTIRRNCDHCVKKKVKCTGETPCHMCRRKSLQCVYSVKKKPGPKSRKRDLIDGEVTDEVDSEPPSPVEKRSKVAHGKGTRSGGRARAGSNQGDDDDALRHMPPSGAALDYQDYHAYQEYQEYHGQAGDLGQPMWGPVAFRRAGPESYGVSPSYYQGQGGPPRQHMQLPRQHLQLPRQNPPGGYPHHGGHGYGGYNAHNNSYVAGPSAAVAMRGHFSHYTLPSPLMDGGDRGHMLDLFDQHEAAGSGGGHAAGGGGSGGGRSGHGRQGSWGDFALVASPQPREVPVGLEPCSAGDLAENSACSTDTEESFPREPLSAASSSSAGAAAVGGRVPPAEEENGEEAAEQGNADADEATAGKRKMGDRNNTEPYYRGAGAPLHQAQEWRSNGHLHPAHVHRRGLSWGQLPPHGLPPLPPFHHAYSGGPTLLSPGAYGPGAGGGGSGGADHEHDQELVHGMFPTMELNGEDYALQHNFGNDLPTLAI